MSVRAGAEGRKAPRSPLPAGFVGMTETGAAEWALCTSGVSPQHMVSHGHMPTPTRCARVHPPGAALLSSLGGFSVSSVTPRCSAGFVSLAAVSNDGSRHARLPFGFPLLLLNVVGVVLFFFSAERENVCVWEEAEGPLAGGRQLRGCLPSTDP